jgi:hypothetical protein
MDDITNLVIRHPRSAYTIESLGPKHFRLSARSPLVVRTDFVVLNDHKRKLECSIWYTGGELLSPAKNEKRACLVYLHGTV